MALIMLGHGLPLQIDVPPGVQDSRKGSIHLQPCSTVEVSDGELAYLMGLKGVAGRITVLQQGAAPKAISHEPPPPAAIQAPTPTPQKSKKHG